MAISLDDLSLLLDVADGGSFSQAAARRRWSQPQVSQRVSALEQELGAQLFRRHRRGAEATEACLALLPKVQEALALLDEGRQAIRGEPAMPGMVLACLPSLSSAIFAPLLARLADAPFEVRCASDHSPVIMERLLSGKVDVGFVLRCPVMAGIQAQLLCRSPIVAAVSARHPLAGVGALPLADIAAEKLAVHSWGDNCQQLQALLRPHRDPARPMHRVLPAGATRELALEHGFLVFVPEMAVRQDFASGRLRYLNVTDLPQWHWEVMMVWRAGKRPDAAKQRVLDTVRAMEW